MGGKRAALSKSAGRQITAQTLCFYERVAEAHKQPLTNAAKKAHTRGCAAEVCLVIQIRKTSKLKRLDLTRWRRGETDGLDSLTLLSLLSEFYFSFFYHYDYYCGMSGPAGASSQRPSALNYLAAVPLGEWLRNKWRKK